MNHLSIPYNPFQVTDTRPSLYPYMQDLRYTRDGFLLLATLLDNTCFCREKKTARNYGPISCSIYVFSGDTTNTLHCIEFQRYTCAMHMCPVNHTPVFSTCGSRVAIVMDVLAATQHFVQVYRLPNALNLQNMCRVSILQHFPPDVLLDLPLPVKLINYLHFKPEFT